MILVQYFCLLLLLLPLIDATFPYPCPFNEKCTCHTTAEGDEESTTIWSAVCYDLTNLVFTAPKNGTYTIELVLLIAGQVDKIPPGAFAAFKYIDFIELVHRKQWQTAPAQWDDEAFQGPEVRIFSVRGLRGAIPPPKALKRLGDNGLKQLQFVGSPDNKETVELSQDIFADYEGLQGLGIYDYQIPNIHPLAFNGLGSLKFLTLANSLQAQSFDLSILYGMNKVNFVEIGASSSLELTVSNVEKVPKSISVIDISSSNSTKISPDIEKLIVRKDSNVSLTLSFSKDITCDKNIHWMAKYALCPSANIIIKDAECSGGKLLGDYLQAAVPDPCKNPSIPIGSDESQPKSNVGLTKRNALRGRLFPGKWAE